MLRLLTLLLYNRIIPPECCIGAGSFFAHPGIGVVLHQNCRIGERLLIGQAITPAGRFGSGAPVIAVDVWFSPGAGNELGQSREDFHHRCQRGDDEGSRGKQHDRPRTGSVDQDHRTVGTGYRYRHHAGR
jgi:hypothetical protein